MVPSIRLFGHVQFGYNDMKFVELSNLIGHLSDFIASIREDWKFTNIQALIVEIEDETYTEDYD